MSYYVTNENSVLNINNAHLKVSGNVMADVMKLGAIEFAPPGSDVGGTVNFTNVTTGVTTSSNLSVGGTLSLGTVEVVATTHTLANTTANGNDTPHTVQFSNATTGIVTTANVEVGKDLTVSGNVSDLNIVSNVNMLHTANTASIKLNSNVVTEFPRSKKLIKYPRVALTSAAGESSGYQGFYVTESSNSANTARHSWKAFNMTFDNTTGDNAWANDQTTTTYSGTDNAYNGSINLGTGAVNGEWIKLQLPHKIKLEYMKIWLKDNDPTRIPEDWILYGSDDNLNWTELFSKTGQGAINENLYNVNANSMYNYLAVVVTKISGQNNYFRIVELEYFGTPEYDPEAHGTDVVVKSVPNVPNTDWLEVYYDGQDYSTMPATVTDKSGNNRTGTPNGGVGFDTEYKAFTFNKTANQYLSTSTPMSGNYVHSFSAWFKPNSLGPGGSGNVGGDTLFYVGGVTGSSDYKVELFMETDRINYTFGGNNFQAYPTIVNGKWYHIVVTYNGLGGQNGREIYLNNVKLNATHSGSTGTLNLPSSNLDIGRYTPDGSATTSAFDGSIANFRLFNRALTSDEIYQLYAYQKEYFGHGDLGMTLKAGRLGIGTSEPRAALDVRGDIHATGRLGIGTSEPQAALDVRGDIHATGSLNPVAGMWTQSIDSSAVTTTIITDIGSCMSTKAADGYGGYGGFTGNAGIFVAPHDGVYQFQFFVIGQSTTSGLLLVFNANGPSVTDGTWNGKNIIGDYQEILDLRNVTNLEEVHGFSTLLNMSKDDTVDIQNHSTGYLGNGVVRCSCFLVHRT